MMADNFTFSGDVTIRSSNLGGSNNTAYGAAATDMETLLKDLARLLPALESRAQAPEELDDVTAVREAQEAAHNGEMDKARALLRSAGAWVARVAEQVGSRLVVDMLTRTV